MMQGGTMGSMQQNNMGGAGGGSMANMPQGGHPNTSGGPGFNGGTVDQNANGYQ